ncbi:MAG: hypothetical protein ABI569_02780 [Casimicrobiaceae bacterium]
MWALMTIHAPGHMSYDSLVQLEEGFSRNYQSWNPPSFSLFLGATYSLFGSTNVALLISQALLVVATYNLAAVPSAPVALRLCAFLSVLFIPIVYIYAGILWKDVFFGHVALMGFAVLHRDNFQPRHMIEAAMLLGAAATIRQQGMVLVLPLLGYAWWLGQARPGIGVLARLILPALALAAFFGAFAAIEALTTSTAVGLPAKPYTTGVQLIQEYDIAGILYRDSRLSLDEFSARPGFDRDRFLEYIRLGYSPERIDFLEFDNEAGKDRFDFAAEGTQAIDRQWRALVMSSPLTYLAHRADVFGWMLGAHRPLNCVPFIDFISSEPPGVAERFGLTPGANPIVRRLALQVSIDVFRPYLFLAGGALAVLVLAIARWTWLRVGVRPDSHATSGAAIATLYLAGLFYALVHFLVGIACDFRYLYFPVLASIVTMAHIFWGGFANVFDTTRGRRGHR